MASLRSRDGEGKIVASRPSPRVLEIRSVGYISRTGLERVLDDAELLMIGHPDIDTLLWNTLRHDGHEPGNPNLGMMFHRRHADRLHRAAMVTHSAPMAALSNIARALFPGLAVGVFGKREEAVAWLTRGHAQHGGKRTRVA